MAGFLTIPPLLITTYQVLHFTLEAISATHVPILSISILFSGFDCIQFGSFPLFHRNLTVQLPVEFLYSFLASIPRLPTSLSYY